MAGGDRVIIFGIDPGLANTGWAAIRCERGLESPVAYGCIATSPATSVPRRLSEIHDGIRDAIRRFGPDECAIESVYFGTNAKSAFATGQARGVALLATVDAGISVSEYSPVQIKSVVAGSGTADKGQIAFMVRSILKLDHDPKPDHAADALAIALTHARLRAWAAHSAAKVG
jgi:crossover junction endodeoxyribonuclease RuvC